MCAGGTAPPSPHSCTRRYMRRKLQAAPQSLDSATHGHLLEYLELFHLLNLRSHHAAIVPGQEVLHQQEAPLLGATVR